MTDYLAEYWNLIRKGKVTVSEHVKMVYKRLAREASAGRGRWVYSPDHANYPIDFIETYCRHSKGEWSGQPVKLELFQKAFIACLFGFIDKTTGLRRFKKAFFLVARKNGKSTMAAAIMLYMLIADGEGGAEIYSVATKKDQAKIIFREACNMVRQSPDLAQIIRKHKTDIEFVDTFSRFEPLSADANTLDGLNSHGVSIDELHAIKGMELYEVMEQSMSARQQAVLLMTTTAGTVRESIYDERYEYAAKVAEWQTGYKDDEFLPILYELDHKDEWTNPKAWPKANPGLGSIKKHEYLSKKVAVAKRSPRLLPGLLTKDFNIRSTDVTTWITYQAAVNQTVVGMDFLRDSYAIGGCDLSATTDMTCSTVLIRKPDDKHYYVLQQYFIPQSKIDQLEHTSTKEAPYRIWAENGWLTICEGSAVNYHDVTEWFVDIVKKHNIRPLWIGYDRALSGYWVPEMEDYGFEMDKIAQGPFTWTQPMKEMAAAFEDHLVIYQDNPVLRWCLTNTGEKSRNDDGIRSIQPVKLSAARRIDGMVSLLNAWTCMLRHYDEYMPYVR